MNKPNLFFPTPVWTLQLDNYQSVNEQMYKFIKKQSADDSRYLNNELEKLNIKIDPSINGGTQILEKGTSYYPKMKRIVQKLFSKYLPHAKIISSGCAKKLLILFV